MTYIMALNWSKIGLLKGNKLSLLHKVGLKAIVSHWLLRGEISKDIVSHWPLRGDLKGHCFTLILMGALRGRCSTLTIEGGISKDVVTHWYLKGKEVVSTQWHGGGVYKVCICGVSKYSHLGLSEWGKGTEPLYTLLTGSKRPDPVNHTTQGQRPESVPNGGVKVKTVNKENSWQS